MSAVEMGKAMKSNNGSDDEVYQYERKLVQVKFAHPFCNRLPVIY